MGLLVRKISRAKWVHEGIKKLETIESDAITACLKTSENTLSLWEIDSIDNLEEAALWILSGQNRPDKFDLVVFNREELDDLELDRTEGQTFIKDASENHIDIINLNYSKLGQVAQLISKHIINGRVHQFTRKKLIELLKEAELNNMLDMEAFNNPAKKDFLKYIAVN